MTVNVELICIGNELLIGKIQNTNATWLAKQATQVGANVRRVTVIQDTIGEIASTLCEAVERKPQLIVTTGGLGPTFDDKTLQGIAKALNRKLEVNHKALEMVKQRCIEYARKRQMPTEIEMTPPQLKMAALPADTEPVDNPIGTAPGARLNLQGTVVFVLPGVPAEMEMIFNQTIAPLLRRAAGDDIFCERSLFVDDIFESRLAPLIDQVMIDNVGVYVKSHPLRSENKPHIELHLTATMRKEDKPSEKLAKAAGELMVLIEKNGGMISAGI